MKYRIFTYAGESLPIAQKLQQEGCEVVVGMVQDKQTIHSPATGEFRLEDLETRRRRLALFDGMLNKKAAEELIEEMLTCKHPEEYFVLFDWNCFFRYSAQIAHMPFHGIFPTEHDYLLEHDREHGKKFVQEHYPALNVAAVHTFDDVGAAAKFLDRPESLWVLKGQDNRTKTFVPDVDDPQLAAEQIIEALKADRELYDESGFILEQLIADPIEITPEKIFYDGVPLATVLDFENKPFGSGNISIQTGCAQDLVFPIGMTDEINSIAFPPIVDELARQHKGLFYWDASLLIQRQTGKIYFGEFCANRPGYNSLFSELSQCSSIDEYFSSCVAKQSPFKLGSVSTSVLLANPETDEETGRVAEGRRIDYKPEVEKHLWLWDARRERNRLVTVGYDWNLAVITGTGDSIDEAVNAMYKSVDGFSFAGAYYRPKSDYLSMDYSTSLLNRVNYGLGKKLYHLPFDVKVVPIKK
ncbi:MAG: hypothetical protein JO354_06145 [Verrucomicrobia bacterium]|nr:hypothetical protein [Verrucomicrobiota bacterium]